MCWQRLRTYSWQGVSCYAGHEKGIGVPIGGQTGLNRRVNSPKISRIRPTLPQSAPRTFIRNKSERKLRFTTLLPRASLTYLVFFVLAWGWIFWRVDWVNQAKPGTVIEIADAGDQVSMFDYFHASLMTIVRHSTSDVVGKNRNGQILVAIHTLMLLDLFAVALGRFYQIITKII